MKSELNYKAIVNEYIRVNAIRRMLEQNGIASGFSRGILVGLLFSIGNTREEITSDFDKIELSIKQNG